MNRALIIISILYSGVSDCKPKSSESSHLDNIYYPILYLRSSDSQNAAICCKMVQKLRPSLINQI